MNDNVNQSMIISSCRSYYVDDPLLLVEGQNDSEPFWGQLVYNVSDLFQRCAGKVTDVIEGHEYEFRVVAVNKAGPGPHSDTSKSVVAKPRFRKCIDLFLDLRLFIVHFTSVFEISTCFYFYQFQMS